MHLELKDYFNEYLHLHLLLGHLADTFIQTDLQKENVPYEYEYLYELDTVFLKKKNNIYILYIQFEVVNCML